MYFDELSLTAPHRGQVVTEMNTAILIQMIVYAIISSGGWLFAYIGVSGIREARKRQEAETDVTTHIVVKYPSSHLAEGVPYRKADNGY